MVLDKPALTDALIQGGLKVDAARRAVELIEQDYADVARQAEVNQRFAEADERNRIRFAAMEKRFEDFKQAMDRRFEDLKEIIDQRFSSTDQHFDSVDQHFDSVDQRFNSVDQRFTMLMWVIGILAATQIAMLGLFIAKIF